MDSNGPDIAMHFLETYASIYQSAAACAQNVGRSRRAETGCTASVIGYAEVVGLGPKKVPATGHSGVVRSCDARLGAVPAIHRSRWPCCSCRQLLGHSAGQRRGSRAGSLAQSLLRRSHSGGAGQALALGAGDQRVLQGVILREWEVAQEVRARAVRRGRRPLPVEQELGLLPGLQPSAQRQHIWLPCVLVTGSHIGKRSGS